MVEITTYTFGGLGVCGEIGCMQSLPGTEGIVAISFSRLLHFVRNDVIGGDLKEVTSSCNDGNILRACPRANGTIRRNVQINGIE